MRQTDSDIKMPQDGNGVVRNAGDAKVEQAASSGSAQRLVDIKASVRHERQN